MIGRNPEISKVAILSIGWQQDLGPMLAETNQFRWHVVEATALNGQVREIWVSEAVAAVVFVGAANAVDHALELLHRLRSTGPPVLVAVADPADARTERLVRQTGAVYLCGLEAQQRLTQVLCEMLCGPGVA